MMEVIIMATKKETKETKATEEKVTAAKAEAKATEAAAEKKTPAKKTAAKKTAAKKTPAKKTAEKKTAAAKKTPAKKTAAKAPARKTAASTKVDVFVEFGGKQVSVDEVVKNVKLTNGKIAKELTIYIKPDESKAYFVADGEEKEMDVFFC